MSDADGEADAPDGPTPDPGTPVTEQVVHCLIGIGAELSAIRAELERYNDHVLDAGDATEDVYECRRCGVTVESEAEAKRHAREAHRAPPGAWRECFS